ncbi:MAG: terminase small subunit [Thaumarchaeota archaeon]|nr:terminase small subunit [Nitrososphaerota archaeon]
MPKDTTLDRPLTPQQKRFAREYVFDLSVTKAAIRSGYSLKTATFSGSRLMADPRIKIAIKEAQEEMANATGITPERVLQEFAKIAFANIKDYTYQSDSGDTCIDLENMSRDAAAALTELTVETAKGKTTVRKVKVKPADKIAALVQLGKHLGMFKEQIEHSGSLTLEQLVTDSMNSKEEAQNNDE